ncbi:MAG: hypothetical protein HGA85_06525 [Nanoarchaeota archaeon]|nr:hypothetical protein [Nanoarchaeota archaeon]
MFEKKAPPPVPDLPPEVFKLLDRIEVIERDHDSMDRLFEMHLLGWESSKSEYTRELRKAKELLLEIKGSIKLAKKDFMALVEVFKLQANTDEFDRLKSMIDSMPMERMMTKVEFERRLKDARR